ncbi:MAG: RDD family protein [Methanosarcina sp.]|uniref:RDD family protein n=1 Tax=Methanosarcina sp. TaxID=2213 RepID=UPI003BB6C2E5
MQWYAGFFRRFLASTIDIFVIILFISFIQLISGVMMDGTFFYALFFLFGWSYFVFQETSTRKGTVGKQAMNLIVTDLKGNKLSFNQATKRFLMKILAAIPLCAGFLPIFFTEKKQTLPDMIAKTVVFIQED